MLFAFDAHFTKQRGCGTRKFANVHITYQVLEGMNTLHLQMAKAAVLKLKPAISYKRLQQVGYFCLVHLQKIDFIQIAECPRISLDSLGFHSKDSIVIHIKKMVFHVVVNSLNTQ